MGMRPRVDQIVPPAGYKWPRRFFDLLYYQCNNQRIYAKSKLLVCASLRGQTIHSCFSIIKPRGLHEAWSPLILSKYVKRKIWQFRPRVTSADAIRSHKAYKILEHRIHTPTWIMSDLLFAFKNSRNTQSTGYLPYIQHFRRYNIQGQFNVMTLQYKYLKKNNSLSLKMSF